MPRSEDKHADRPVILTEELRKELTDRVFGKGDHQAHTVSAQMKRDQQSADRINAWVNRFVGSPKNKDSAG